MFSASEVSGPVKAQRITSHNHRLKQATVAMFLDLIQTQVTCALFENPPSRVKCLNLCL